MQRRDFIGLIGATALSIPRPGYTQTQTDMPLVGLLVVQKPDMTAVSERIAALRKGLQDEGFIDGMNYSLAVRSAERGSWSVSSTCYRIGYSSMHVSSSSLALSTEWITVLSSLFRTVPVDFYGQAADLIKARRNQKLYAPGRDLHRKRAGTQSAGKKR